jgi:hypothetical protein
LSDSRKPFVRSRLPEGALTVLGAVAVAALLRGGNGNFWTPLFVGCFGALCAVLPGFRLRVRGALARAWQSAVWFPTGESRIPWNAVLLLAVLPDALFLMLRDQGIQSGDSRPVVLTAASLITRQRMELTPYAENYARLRLFTATEDAPYFFLRRPDGLYSHYPSGMVPFALPVVAASWALGADLDSPLVHERLEKLAAALVSGACLGLFFLLALHLVDARTAFAATWILATGSVMFSTVGQALWQHGGVIMWTEILLLVEFSSWQAPSWKATALQGVACAMMLACRLSAGLIVGSFGAWVFVRSPLRALTIAVIAAAAVMPWAAMNWSVYGTPLGPMGVQTSGGLWAASDPSGWCGVLVSPTHGLAVYQPWLLVGLLSLLPAFRRYLPAPRAALPRGWQMWALLAIGLHLALVSSWRCWWGGWCWGSRLAAEAIPLAALLVLGPMAMLLTTSRGRAVIVSLAVAGALVHIPSVYLRQARWYDSEGEQVERAQWRWSAPPFLYPLRR